MRLRHSGRRMVWCCITLIGVLMFAAAAFGQNVFPITVSGQTNIYVDTNDNDAVDEDTDGYFTLTLVKLVDAGDDSGKFAVLFRGHKGMDPQGDYGQVFVLDGFDDQQRFVVHEVADDITYLGDDGSEVPVKVIWAYTTSQTEKVVDDYMGFLHELILEMTDPADPFAGYNKLTVTVEHDFTTLGGDPVTSTVTVEYNGGDYADTVNYSGQNLLGALAGNILTDIGQFEKTEFIDDGGTVTRVSQEFKLHETSGYTFHKVFIPVADDGSITLSDGRADGFVLRTAVKPVKDADPTPAQMPDETAAGDDDADDAGDETDTDADAETDSDSDAASTSASNTSSSSDDDDDCMISSVAGSPAQFGHLWLVLLLAAGIISGYLARK